MKNSKAYLILISALCGAVLVTNVLRAQTFTNSYRNAYNGLRAEGGKMLADGNLLIGGIASPSVADLNLLFLKLNPENGDTIWAKQISVPGDRLSNLHFDEMGNGDIIATTSFIAASTIYDTNKVMVLSLDSSGSLNWAKYYNYLVSNHNPSASFVKRIAAAEFIVSIASFNDTGIVMVKMNTHGDVLFTKTFNADSLFSLNDLFLTDVVNTGDGYLFSGNIRYSEFENDLLLIKTDTSGNLLWVKSDAKPTRGIVVPGYSLNTGQMYLAADSNIVVGIEGNGVGLMKITRNGDYIWTKFVNDTESYITYPSYGFMTPAAGGGYYIAGNTDFSERNGYEYNNAGRQMIFKFDSSGNALWAKTYEFEKNLNNCVFLFELANHSLVTAGTIFDTDISTTEANSKYYLMKLDSLGTSAGFSCGTDSNYSYYSFSLSPVNYTPTYSYTAGLAMSPTTVNDSSVALIKRPVSLMKGVSLFSTLDNSSNCYGDPVFFTAISTNDGTSINYNFLVNGVSVQSGPSNAYSTTALFFPDTVQCILTSTGPCGTPDTVFSNKEVPFVEPISSPTVIIVQSPPGVIAAGSIVTFNAVATDTGSSPYYLWRKNGIYVSSHKTYIDSSVANGDEIICKVIADYLCTEVDSGVAVTWIVVAPLGSGSQAGADGFVVAPNPAKNMVSITVAGSIPPYDLVVRDIVGSIVLKTNISDKSFKLDVSTLAPGFYGVELFCGQNKYIDKLIIAR